MSQPAKAQEPSMEEILASIRRIIADDEAKPAAKAAEPPPPPKAAPKPAPAPAPAPEPAAEVEMSQDDIDAMLAGFDDKPAAKVEPEPEPEPEPEVLDLTEAMEAEPEPPAFRTIDARPDVVFDEAPPPPPPQPVARRVAPPPPPPQPAPEMVEPPLMSSSAHAAVGAAFNSLAHTVLVQNATTLEDLVKEMLRPMLKTWLDDNLPGLVERMVRAEIERVSRGRN